MEALGIISVCSLFRSSRFHRVPHTELMGVQTHVDMMESRKNKIAQGLEDARVASEARAKC